MAKFTSSFSFLFQALILPSKNPKLFSHLFFIAIISRVFLYLGNYLLTNPLTSEILEISKELPTVDPTNPEFMILFKTLQKDTKELLILALVNALFLFIISFIISIVVYSAYSATSIGEILTLKEVFNKAKGNIKGPLITQVVITLFCLVYILIFGIIIGVVRYMSTGDIIWVVILISMLPITLYLSVIWSMSIVISVIETSRYGFTAISHAMKLLKGRKMQIFLLILISLVLSIVVYGFNFIIGKFAPSSSVILGGVLMIFGEGATLYNMSAVTVLYYECNQSYGEEIASKGLYDMVPNTDIV